MDTLLTGMPTIHAIHHYYGTPAALITGVATFLSCFFFTMGNITGSGAGLNLVTGINWKIGSIVMIVITLGGPNWSEFGHALTHWSVAPGSLATSLAYVSTKPNRNRNKNSCTTWRFTRLIFRKDINEQNNMPQPRVLQFFMLVSYLFALIMTGSSLIRIFGK